MKFTLDMFRKQFQNKFQALLLKQRQVIEGSLKKSSIIFIAGFFVLPAFADLLWTQSSNESAITAKSQIWTITIENLKGEQKQIYCEAALSELEKRRGLMFRDKLAQDECMIFLFDPPTLLSFWMKNTYIPLSIAFVNEKLQIMEMYDMKPMDENIINSTNPGLYAIEVNRGWFKKNVVYQGSKIKITKKDLRKNR